MTPGIQRLGAIETRPLRRVFSFNGIEIPDPDSNLQLEQVRDVLAVQYPSITTAALEGPELAGDKMLYTFKRAVGTKG